MDLSYLLELRVQFIDDKAAAQIKPETFQAKLTSLGFVLRTDMKPEHPLAKSLWIDTAGNELLCPDHDRYSDYGRRACELVRDMAHVSQKTHLAMFHELMTSQA